jgi:hypothetical protein
MRLKQRNLPFTYKLLSPGLYYDPIEDTNYKTKTPTWLKHYKDTHDRLRRWREIVAKLPFKRDANGNMDYQEQKILIVARQATQSYRNQLRQFNKGNDIYVLTHKKTGASQKCRHPLTEPTVVDMNYLRNALRSSLKGNIQTIRSARKFNPERHIMQDGTPQRIAGCYYQPGVNEWRIVRKSIAQLQNAKVPLSNDPHVGIELELFYPLVNHAQIVTALGKSKFRNSLSFGSDGSIRIEDMKMRPTEVRYCVPMSQLEEATQEICSILQKGKGAINKSCGLHVHLDQRQFIRAQADFYVDTSAAKKRAERLIKAQGILFPMTPASRRSNTYARRSSLIDFTRAERYSAINWQSISEHKTIEVRLHAGTLNPRKIINWVKLLSHIQDDPEMDQYQRTPTSMTTWKKHIEKYDPDLWNYVEERVMKFTNIEATEEN